MLSRWRPGLTPAQLRVAAGLGLFSAAVGFLPLFGGPGYELALALGLTLPLGVAAASAWTALRALQSSRDAAPFAVLLEALRFALLVLGSQLLIALAHGARAGFCDVSGGLILLGLGPGLGTLLAAALGAGAGLIAFCSRRGSGRALALGLAAAGPVGGILVSLWRFWSSPMIFAFDPFVGFFAGTLYDTVIDAVPRLLTYRVGSAGTLLALASAAALLERSPEGGVRLVAGPGRWGSVLLALIGTSASLGVYAWGPALGHYQTTATISAALGQTLDSERCQIIYDPSLGRERALLLGRECDGHVAAQLEYFDAPAPPRVRVFAFASSAQKGRLMGASNTYIAKPWRGEVYVQNDNYPHPVLAHELAHVIAGSFARGPWRVAGPLGGWWPDPGRIEGFAVAAAPPLDGEYTLLEWTRALHDLKLLPELRSIFRLSFLGKNSSTAYTVAGAVVEWLRARHGAAALRAWYGGESIERAFGGASLAGLEREFLADLQRVQLSPRGLELARARFDRPAIFGRRCPHIVDEQMQEAEIAFDRLDFSGAEAAYQRSLKLDPQNFGARLGLAACAQRRGERDLARDRYAALSNDPGVTRVQRGVVLERLGDLAYLEQRVHAAVELYGEAERYALDEHRARTLEVKRYGVSGGQERDAIRELLIGDAELGPDVLLSAAALGAWSARDHQLGLAHYLIGKNLFGRGRLRAANEYLQLSLARELPLASVRREALRSSVLLECALGDRSAAQRSWTAFLADPGLSLAKKSGMQRFAQSCGLPALP